jgi:tRNA(Ile)-lysidine synthase
MSLDPAVAAVRLAVRRELPVTVRGEPDGPGEPGGTVLVACSGGADSLALLSAAVFEGHRRRVRVAGVTVDHGLQPGSAAQAEAVVAQMVRLGVDETVSVRVAVTASGQGPEAAAREARYAVLGQVSQQFGDADVLLGHTLDDQAETVLLGLVRGSGARALSGMRRGFGPYRRPLLDLTRAHTEAACRAEGIEFWRDPHNEDPRFTRSRVRHRVLPVLEEELGPGVAVALARTADLLREDSWALDQTAELVRADLRRAGGIHAPGLAGAYPAVRLRVLRLTALEAGCPASELFRVHVLALADLVTRPPSHRQVQLPGHLTAYREGDLLRFRRTAVAG